MDFYTVLIVAEVAELTSDEHPGVARLTRPTAILLATAFVATLGAVLLLTV
jgi:hypothetical protein